MQNIHLDFIHSDHSDKWHAIKLSTLARLVFVHRISIDFQELKSHSMCISSWQNIYNILLFDAIDERVHLFKTSKAKWFFRETDLQYCLAFIILTRVTARCSQGLLKLKTQM